MRPRPWGWTPAGRRRYAILALWLGHLGWVVLGHGHSTRWQALLGTLSWPVQKLSAPLLRSRANRAEHTRNLERAQYELAMVRQRLESLQMENARQAPRLQEADEAIRILGLKKQVPLEMKAARVMVNVRTAPFGGMILDQGLDAGLVRDQGVFCPEGVVGRIWEVSQRESSLLPLDAYNSSTAVMLAQSRATGVLQGVGPGRAEIRYIGSQEVVQVGEPVYTSGLDRVFPRGLLVGYVVGSRPEGPELQVDVALAAPLNRVHQVLILPTQPRIDLPVPAPREGKVKP
ncbi:rod shape-determining protein MreC [Holophaga foetida]|uniref:rod shape-determining protein MreC n=1 Tax=Holophaga foetida TaxID=35839 RepID=UPI00024732CD|nr:rod shape-determining protein MreC [Holophaga foetida]